MSPLLSCLGRGDAAPPSVRCEVNMMPVCLVDLVGRMGFGVLARGQQERVLTVCNSLWGRRGSYREYLG